VSAAAAETKDYKGSLGKSGSHFTAMEESMVWLQGIHQST